MSTGGSGLHKNTEGVRWRAFRPDVLSTDKGRTGFFKNPGGLHSRIRPGISCLEGYTVPKNVETNSSVLSLFIQVFCGQVENGDKMKE